MSQLTSCLKNLAPILGIYNSGWLILPVYRRGLYKSVLWSIFVDSEAGCDREITSPKRANMTCGLLLLR